MISKTIFLALWYYEGLINYHVAALRNEHANKKIRMDSEL